MIVLHNEPSTLSNIGHALIYPPKLNYNRTLSSWILLKALNLRALPQALLPICSFTSSFLPVASYPKHICEASLIFPNGVLPELHLDLHAHLVVLFQCLFLRCELTWKVQEIYVGGRVKGHSWRHSDHGWGRWGLTERGVRQNSLGVTQHGIWGRHHSLRNLGQPHG